MSHSDSASAKVAPGSWVPAEQALDWLRADLAFWTKFVSSDQPNARPRVHWFM
jgi:hypothetical protein